MTTSHATLGPAQIAHAKQRILELRGEGYSGAYCAAQAGISRRCLYTWMEADAEFRSAWSDANECHHDWYEDRLRDGAAAGHDVATIVGLKMAGRFIERQAPAVQVVSLYQVFQQILAPQILAPPGPESAPRQVSIIEQAPSQLEQAPGPPQLEDGSTHPAAKGKPSARPASRRRPERQPLPR